MSDKPRSPSRRALLRMVGLTPLALAAFPSLGAAQTPPQKLPQDIEDEVRKEARKQGKGDKEDRVVEIADRLWTMFLLAIANKATVDSSANARAVELSAAHVVRNEARWSDPAENDQTVLCAIRCGMYARDLAKKGVIDGAVFNEAWDRARYDFFALLKRASVVKVNDSPIKGAGTSIALAC